MVPLSDCCVAIQLLAHSPLAADQLFLSVGCRLPRPQQPSTPVLPGCPRPPLTFTRQGVPFRPGDPRRSVQQNGSRRCRTPGFRQRPPGPSWDLRGMAGGGESPASLSASGSDGGRCRRSGRAGYRSRCLILKVVCRDADRGHHLCSASRPCRSHKVSFPVFISSSAYFLPLMALRCQWSCWGGQGPREILKVINLTMCCIRSPIGCLSVMRRPAGQSPHVGRAQGAQPRAHLISWFVIFRSGCVAR